MDGVKPATDTLEHMMKCDFVGRRSVRVEARV